VPQAFHEAGIEDIKTYIPNACADLVFNLDDIGIIEWEDRIERKVIVPSIMRGEKIFHGIHRRLKHISVVACISASGDRTRESTFRDLAAHRVILQISSSALISVFWYSQEENQLQPSA
jgi:hypothetical protein